MKMDIASHKFYTGFASASAYDVFNLRKELYKTSGAYYEEDGCLTPRDKFLSASPLAGLEASSRSGYKVRTYRSGEMTGGLFLTGRQGRILPTLRSGVLETKGFSIPGRMNIRRAVENSINPLKYFITLTFAPQQVAVDHNDWLCGVYLVKFPPLNDDGTVNHQWAKENLKRFLNTVSVRFHRQNKKHVLSLKLNGATPDEIKAVAESDLLYLWVAEIQEETTHNIHFHIMWDRFVNVKWLKQIWGQASNSVNAKQLNNTRHSANYIRGYINKDENLIQGNRYFICHKLRKFMEPTEKIIVQMHTKDAENYDGNPAFHVQDTLNALAHDIRRSGGRVLDFGFSIPAPRTGKRYKNKSGHQRTAFEITRSLGPAILAAIEEELDNEEYPF